VKTYARYDCDRRTDRQNRCSTATSCNKAMILGIVELVSTIMLVSLSHRTSLLVAIKRRLNHVWCIIEVAALWARTGSSSLSSYTCLACPSGRQGGRNCASRWLAVVDTTKHQWKWHSVQPQQSNTPDISNRRTEYMGRRTRCLKSDRSSVGYRTDVVRQALTCRQTDRHSGWLCGVITNHPRLQINGILTT